MSKSIKERALVYLCKELRCKKCALRNAEERNATQVEREALVDKLEVLDWLLGLTIKEDEVTHGAALPAWEEE